MGRVQGPLCPVAAILTRRGSQTGPLFTFKDGKALTRTRFVQEIKTATEKAGLNSRKYNGHSFRSGAVAIAIQQGIGDATVQMLGRWRNDAYKTYMKTPRERLAEFFRVLASSGSRDCSKQEM